MSIQKLIDLINESDENWLCKDRPDESIMKCSKECGIQHCLKRKYLLEIKEAAFQLSLTT